MINPAESIQILLQELKRQKAEGATHVGVSAESIQLLKSLSCSIAKDSSVTKPSIAVKEPVKITPKKSPPSGTTVSQSVRNESSISVPPPPIVALPAGTKIEQMQWLQEIVSECEQTRHHLKNGIKPLLGFGSLEAKIVLVGDVPSIEEIEAGRPFVGDVAVTLQKILKETGLTENDVYLVNSMVWRPATPTPHAKAMAKEWEIAYNKPYIKAVLNIIRAQCVMALGQQAVHALTGTKETISHLRGVWQEVEGFPLMSTFHPNYILNSPSITNKRKVWEDFLKVMEKLNLPISSKQRDYFLK